MTAWNGVVHDTLLYHHLCFPQFGKSDAGKDGDDQGRTTEGGHSLAFCGSQLTNKPAWKDEKAILELYCARDVDVTAQVFSQLKPLLRLRQLEETYKLVSVPMAKICRLLYETGFRVDPSKIHAVRERIQGEMLVEEALLPELLRTQSVPINRRQVAPPGTLSAKTGKPLKFLLVPDVETVVPWRSDKVVGRWLYEDLGLAKQLHIKSNRVTTDKTALDKLWRKTNNRAIKAIRILRSLDETITTFAKEAMSEVERMYPHFNVHGTASGRLSSSDPNLQNIPESARCIYVPSHAGWKIVSADYSQIENRLTAYFAGDSERLNRFLEDPDFSEHKWVTSQFFGIPYADVIKSSATDSLYRRGKIINHGKGYRMGAIKISKQFDLPLKEVKDLCAIWDKINAKTIQWQGVTSEEAKRDGMLRNPFGRLGFFYTEKGVATECVAYRPQSSAADILFRAMIGLMFERVGWPEELARRVSPVLCPLPWPARMLLTVHDSLVVECPDELVEEVIRVMKLVMEQGWPELGGMSIPVAFETGLSWGELDKYTLPVV